MRILMTMNLPYEPALGGASKANRIIAEMLAKKGYSVCVVAPAALEGVQGGEEAIVKGDAPTILELEGVEVHAVDISKTSLRSYLARELQSYVPDCIVVSSEDPLQGLLYEAVCYAPKKVIYLTHSPNCLPFGPSSFCRSDRGLTLMKKIAAVVAVSQFAANYIKSWSDIEPIQIYLPVYGRPPFPNYGRYEKGYITLINPCAYKGVDIFIQLAKSLEQNSFAAVPTWGTTREDCEKLQSLSNVKLLVPSPDINNIFSQTSILIVPSICLENLPMVIIESMLRGIPVVASNVGGIQEAKLGTNYLIHVDPIGIYTRKWDEKNLWIPIAPPQNITPWKNALDELSDKDKYETESIKSRSAAISFVENLNLDPIEKLINSVVFG